MKKKKKKKDGMVLPTSARETARTLEKSSVRSPFLQATCSSLLVGVKSC